MDELDGNLLEAWERVWARCEADPDEARRRWLRSGNKMLKRPPRAWCLSVRASDHRIGQTYGYIEDEQAWRRGGAHAVVLDGWHIQELCRPVFIPKPGVLLKEAAAILGRDPATLAQWWMPERAKRGPGRSRRDGSVALFEEITEPGRVLGVRFEPARIHRSRGVPKAVVWTERAVDPGADCGVGPHALWGTLWHWFYQRVDEGMEVELERVPRKRQGTARDSAAGWSWVCPGRVDERGRRNPCGRLAHRLYLPLPMMTLGRWIGERRTLKVAGEAGLHWRPGQAAGLRAAGAGGGGMQLACARCWQVRSQTFTNDNGGWDEVIGYLSGGFLYGREVRKPDWFGYERKRRRKGGKEGRRD